ncbi:hypothetical protein vseg_009910 [Gypsophila vaccaria]
MEMNTELRLGLPGIVTKGVNKRSFVDIKQECTTPPTKTQVVGWPPVRSYRKNCIQATKKEGENNKNNGGSMYVKVSMDGAPYLRKIDMKLYTCYAQLFRALELMFNVQVGECSKGEYVTTYEDKDGDWMLVGDVPWEMFINSCKRLRILKGDDTQGLACFT